MLLSLHGGHSGEFCNHAQDFLEDIVLQYIKLGFTHLGISEHMPPVCASLMYDDEKEAGLTPDFMNKRFATYIDTCNSLKAKYKNQIIIFTGFETEAYSGYESFIPFLIKKYSPNYIVGSVHHINDLCFDFSEKHYAEAVDSCGGIMQFYEKYFDVQYEMLQCLRPQVVGHFDLARIFDSDYELHLNNKSISWRINRNLEFIAANNLILDYNQRALLKNMKEPYPSGCILEKAMDMGIKIVPGDDSHGISDAGFNINSAMNLLLNKGVILDENLFVNFF